MYVFTFNFLWSYLPEKVKIYNKHTLSKEKIDGFIRFSYDARQRDVLKNSFLGDFLWIVWTN